MNISCYAIASGTFNADSLEKAIPSQTDNIKVASLNRLVEFYLANNQPQISLKMSLKALDIAEKIKNENYRLIIMANLVEVYISLELDDNALKLSNEVEILSSKLKKNDIKAKNYFNSAVIYRKNSDFSKAEKHYRLALLNLQDNTHRKRHAIQPHDSIKAEFFLGLGVSLRYQDRFTEAMQSYQKGLSIAETLNLKTLLAAFYSNIGELYELEGETEKAFEFIQKSMTYDIQTNNFTGLHNSYTLLASIEMSKDHYDKTIDLLNKSVDVAEKNKDYYGIKISYLYLYGAYSAKRDHKTALSYIRRYEQYSIPQAEADTNEYVSKVESSYELDKKNKEKEILNLKMAREESKYLNIIMIIVLLSTITFTISYFKAKQKKINELVLKEGKARAELDALQARINPHFLFNSLNSLGSLISRDPKNADLMLQNLSKLLRYTLQTAKKNLVSLAEEMSTVRNYLHIEKIRFEERLDFVIDCPDCLKNLLIPPLIIQPLVENSLKYAVGRMIKDGKIEISCSTINNKLQIRVKDNGPLSDKPLPKTNSTGFGMKYITERLRLMYGTNYSFDVNRENGYQVTITIPSETINSDSTV